MILLRSLNTCRVDPNIDNGYRIYHLALGFVVHLALLAKNLVREIFKELKSGCEARRERKRTSKLMKAFASFLGQIFAEMRYLHAYAESFPNVGSKVNLISLVA